MRAVYPVNEATVVETLRRLSENIAAIASTLQDDGQPIGQRLGTYVDGLRRAIIQLERKR